MSLDKVWIKSGSSLDQVRLNPDFIRARQQFDAKKLKVMEELIQILRKRVLNRENARQLAEEYAALVVDENKLLIKDFNIPHQVNKVC